MYAVSAFLAQLKLMEQPKKDVYAEQLIRLMIAVPVPILVLL